MSTTIAKNSQTVINVSAFHLYEKNTKSNLPDYSLTVGCGAIKALSLNQLRELQFALNSCLKLE